MYSVGTVNASKKGLSANTRLFAVVVKHINIFFKSLLDWFMPVFVVLN